MPKEQYFCIPVEFFGSFKRMKPEEIGELILCAYKRSSGEDNAEPQTQGALILWEPFIQAQDRITASREVFRKHQAEAAKARWSGVTEKHIAQGTGSGRENGTHGTHGTHGTKPGNTADSAGGMPDSAGGMPDSAGGMPDSAGGMPDSAGGMPDSCQKMPTKTKTITKTIRSPLTSPRGGERETCYSFEQFWEDYGKKVDRQTAEKKFSKLSEADRAAVKEAVPRYVAATPFLQFRLHASTYLNERRWEDQIVQRSAPMGRAEPVTHTQMRPDAYEESEAYYG